MKYENSNTDNLDNDSTIHEHLYSGISPFIGVDDVDNRQLWLTSELNEGWLEYERLILKWNEEDRGLPIEERTPIRLYFFTPGGDVYVANSFIDILRMSKTPTIGINMGMAFSGGAFVYLATQKRYTMPNAYFLIHSGETEYAGNTVRQVKDTSAHLNQLTSQLEYYIISTTGLSKDMVSEKMCGEWYIDSKQAIEYNIAHQVITDINQIM